MTSEIGRTKKPYAHPPSSEGGKGYAYTPTDEMRDKVKIWIGAGMTETDIAAVLRIDRMTLRAHYEYELKHGRAEKFAEIMDIMFQTAKAGNVTAQKAYVQIMGAAAAEASFLAPTPEVPKAPKLGKKEEAAVVAQSAGQDTDWGSDLQVPGSEARN